MERVPAMSDPTLAPVERFQHLLLATDGSEYSAGAVRVAGAWARQRGARLTILSIALYTPETETLEPTLGAEAERQAQERVEAARASLGDLACATEVRLGADPARSIAAAAEELGADVIVMGRRGRRGLARWMLGDATAKTIGYAPCSVLMVPRESALWHKRILVASDGSRYGEAAARAAGRLAQLDDLPLSAVSVVAPSHGPARRQEAEGAITRIQHELGARGLTVGGQVLDGRPDQAIVAAAVSLAADLVVVGSHGRTGLEKMLMGSISERVLNQAQCPVLVVKPA